MSAPRPVPVLAVPVRDLATRLARGWAGVPRSATGLKSDPSPDPAPGPNSAPAADFAPGPDSAPGPDTASPPGSAPARAWATARGWAATQADAYRAPSGDPRPLGGYVSALAAYGGFVGATTAAAKATGRSVPHALPTPWEVLLLGTATQKLARTLTKAAVTSPLRAPFTVYEGPGNHGEVMEAVRYHGGVRHTVGELLTCPFCMAQWAATAMLAGRVFAPRATRLLMTLMAAVTVADGLQSGYDALRQSVEN